MSTDGRSRLVYFISGMWCSTCSKSIGEAVGKIEGVRTASVNYASKLLVVELKEDFQGEVLDSEIQSRVRRTGFGVRKLTSGWTQGFREDLKKEELQKLSWVKVSLVWFLAMWSSMIAFAGYGGGLNPQETFYLSLASSIFGVPAILIGIHPYALSGLRALFYSRLLTLDFFIFLGGVAASSVSIFYLAKGQAMSYADSGSMILAILLLTKRIENSIIQKVTSTILFQLHATRDTFSVFRNDKWIQAKSDQIRKGDRVRILAGETIPFDGALQSQSCEVNNHLITGEGRSISLVSGDHLFAGAIASTDIELEVIHAQGDRRIDAWAEAALIGHGKETSMSRLFKELEQYLVSTALVSATLIAAYKAYQGAGATQVAESFFVGILIFCPCLFASVIPLAKQMAHLSLLRVGILVSKSESLFDLDRLNHFYIDKTGTLEAVESRFEPFRHIPLLEHYLSDLARKSLHPILRGLKTLDDFSTISNLEETPGNGVVAKTSDGHELIVGRPKFLKNKGVELPKHSGNLFPLVSFDGLIAGQIISKKTYDRRAKEFLRKLKIIRPLLQIEILSGDPNPTAGQNLLDHSKEVPYTGNLSPEEKAARIQKGSAFAGDGLNDTLALARADVSFLIGHRVLGFAPVDFHIQLPNINLILATFLYAKRFKKVIYQTILAAFTYNLIAVTLAFNGLFSPLGAVIAMTVSFVLLLSSTARLLKPPEVPR